MQSQRDKEYDRKHIQVFKDTWLTNLSLLRKDDNSDKLYFQVCEMFLQTVYDLGLYKGKSLIRKDTPTSLQLIILILCVSK
jgi:hypothetical protein